MKTARELLTNLLANIKEQAKDINPHGYRIGNVKSFAKNRQEVAGSPGVEFDIKLEGDHIWMRVLCLSLRKPVGRGQTRSGNAHGAL
jgi:hypothetical protein